jgi:hypothetical protein
MADAIVKLSWRKTPSGFVLPGAAEGGIAGTCFTLESGMTLTAADTMAGLFKPNPGFDACRVCVVERSGRVTEIPESSVEPYPAHDVSLLAGFQAEVRYALSTTPGSVPSCSLIGYRAHAAPFSSELNAACTAIEIAWPRVETALQMFTRQVPRSVVLDVKAADMTVRKKAGFVVDLRAPLGLAGAPMVDERDASVVGLCILGLPADAPVKSQIGIIDLRPFLLA